MIVMVSATASFLALCDVEWFQRQFSPFLTHEDALCLSLMAIECELTSLRHVLLRSSLPIAPISTRQLVDFAAERGWWHLVTRLQCQCRRARRSIRLSITQGVEMECQSVDPAFLKWQWIQKHHPLVFAAEVMYAAARRGCLEEVVWLHRHINYHPLTATIAAAKAGHLTVLQWILDHHKTAQKPEVNSYLQTVCRQQDSTVNAICWRNGLTLYCATANKGYLPVKDAYTANSLTHYPLMDVAAERGDLALLQKLHEDHIWTKTCSSMAMRTAVKQGHLEIIQWLHEHRTEHIDSVDDIITGAAECGHVVILNWLEETFDMKSSISKAYKAAIFAGQYHSVRWFLAHFDRETCHLESVFPLLVFMRSYSVELVKLVCETHGWCVDWQTVQSAARYGNYEAVRWMVAEIGEQTQDVREALLLAAVQGGSLHLIRWCVEELGAWTTNAAAIGAKYDHLAVLEYLLAKAHERALATGSPVDEHVDFGQIDVVEMLVEEEKYSEASVQWVLEHCPEAGVAWSADLDEYLFRYLSSTQFERSWRLRQSFMRFRPSACCRLPFYPLWAIQYGSLEDLKCLEAMRHPNLFTKKVLMWILMHSRDEELMQWFLTRTDSSWVDLRVVSWAARYGAVELLSSLVAITLSRGPSDEDAMFQLKVFSTVTWVATHNDQTSVLDWVERRQLSQEIGSRLWTLPLAKMAARYGRQNCLSWLIEHHKVSNDQMSDLAGTAACFGQIESLQEICRDFELNCTPSDILKTARKGHFDVLEYILTRQPHLLDTSSHAMLEIRAVYRNYHCLTNV